MVQRKEPSKLKPKIKQVSKPHSFDLHESPRSKGKPSSDNSKKKTMKYLPNYMKPTTSSDARKDQLQVTPQKTPSITNSSRKSNPKSSSPPSVTSKRKSLTPLLKRNKSKVVFQRLNLNRATCSSTLKDSKFPKALDLNPGATESEGTSVLRVCPYTYCSLNGHMHEPVPPLKSFLASKRKLIKTQQNMKLKGFSPFRKREPKRCEKELSPLIKEVVNDFIVEIYASANEKIVDPVKSDEVTASECLDSKREEEEEEEEVVSTGLDLKSDFSLEEMDAMVKLVEYVSCDHEVETITEKCSDPVVEDAGEENPVGFNENFTKFEAFKEFGADFMDDLDVFSDSESFSTDHTDGGFNRSHEQFSEQTVESVVEEMHSGVASESEIHNQIGIGSKKEGDEGANKDENFNSIVDLEEKGNDAKCEVIPRREEELFEIVTSDCSKNEIAIEVSDNSNRRDKEEEDEEDDSKTQEVEEPNSTLEVEEEENHQEEEIKLSGTELDHANEDQTDPKEHQNEVIGMRIEECELEAVENPTCTETVLDHEDEKPELNQPKEEPAVAETSPMDQLCVAFSEMRIEGEDHSFDPTCQQKNRLIIARRRPMSGEDEYMRGFNPRGPNFLPLVPDPESEKVDLRHQMMDERKNAEEWMLDYALRRAVNQLAPARKKKVELLVAAFEKVVPVVPARGGVTCG